MGRDLMTLVETLPVDRTTAQWEVWTTLARVVVTDPSRLAEARRIVTETTDAVDLACSRFRPDSELSRLAGHHGRARTVSPLLAELVRAALTAARLSDGAVTPTLGTALDQLGYDRDWSRMGAPGRPVRLVVGRAPSWRDVVLDGDDRLTLPAGVVLDLGSTAKAWTADAAARRVADELGVGALVGLGGDLATSGPGPVGGWRVLVRDQQDDPSTVVTLPAGAAIATSSTRSRRWRSGGRELHHIVDPQTCLPVEPAWRSVTVAAPDCVTANTLTTAALVLGSDAVARLRRSGMPARLVTPSREVLTLNDWPTEVAS
ncbi:MAG: FAD:protein FMN transferase [Actinomycetes bacterium]